MSIKILLIDDDIICNMANERLMQSMNLAIETKAFIDPTQALTHLQDPTNNYDLVILDINMPRLNGWEFLEKYQKLEKRFPIIMLTSSIDANDKKKAKGYQILSGYHVKPLNKTDLLDILKNNKIL